MAISQIFFWAVPFVATASNLLLLLIFLISKRDLTMRYYTMIVASLTVWSLCALLVRFRMPPGELFWAKCCLCGLFFAPLALYHLVCSITAGAKRGGVIFWNAVTLLNMACTFSGAVVKSAAIETAISPSGAVLYSYNYELGPLAWLCYSLTALFAFGVFIKAARSRHAIEPEQFSQIVPVFIAEALVFIGCTCNMIPAVGGYPIDIFFCILASFIIFGAIFKYRLFEMRFITVRGLIFAAFSAAVFCLYGGAVYLCERYLRPFGAASSIAIAVMALICVGALHLLFTFSRKLTDLIFYHDNFEHRNALQSYRAEVSSQQSLGGFAMQLLQAVERGIDAGGSCLLLQDPESGIYKVFASTLPLTLTDLNISETDPLINRINLCADCLKVEELSKREYKELLEAERKVFTALDIQLIIPAKCRGVLIGFILLSSKRDGTCYTLDDLGILKTFGETAANAVDSAQMFRRMQQQSTTDDLTGLYNTRYLYQYLPTVVTPKCDSPVSVIILDVDLFRVYNDLYGHLEGDKALRRIASLIRGMVGPRGICTRYGGEEFAVVLPNFDSGRAYKLAEKIRDKVSNLFFGDNQDNRRFLTVSIGICTYPLSAPNQDELMLRADLALYTAKNSGKNKTVLYSSKLTSERRESAPAGKAAVTAENFAADILNSPQRPAYAATLYALTAAIDTKDHFTFNHSQNVARYASALAAKLGMAPSHVSIIAEAGLLHDVGKIGIPEHILAKPDLLTEEEYSIMQQHVEMSITIVKHLPSLNYVIPAIMGHHERWDGNGYPRHLKGEQIPISARCLAIADCFDAIISKRPYKGALSLGFALKEIESCSGTHFDPQIAKVFVEMVRNGELEIQEDGSQPPIELSSETVS